MKRRGMTGLIALLCLASVAACGADKAAPTKASPSTRAKPDSTGAARPDGSGAGAEAGTEQAEAGEDALAGESAHVIPFADRTSMGYLLLLPPGTEQPSPPTREQLAILVEQAFPDRRRDGEIDLLLKLVATEPHSTDASFNDKLVAPSVDDVELPAGGEIGGEAGDEIGGEAGDEIGGRKLVVGQPDGSDELAAKRERERIFDLIGLHIEVIHLGVGDNAAIPSTALQDPILTRGVTDEQRKSLLGRSWAVLLRADYRNQHAVRGLRLHQTLVRVVADHYGALIHDPDTLETMNSEEFTERRLRASAGNVADQIAIVPFTDGRDDNYLRLSTRGMRRFGAVDLELDGLVRDPVVLQRASDLLAGLALALVKDGEVDSTGFAVEVPAVIEVDAELVRQSYSTREYQPPTCTDCPATVEVHLVERAPEDHDPEHHVVARVVAPREQSDASDYDHPQWVLGALRELFGAPPG